MVGKGLVGELKVKGLPIELMLSSAGGKAHP